eukprot:TRINITY_DN83503_c0_g1_i1.p1 TRINITY_DN83503_c0_g1~~TRINITY_DN83503_c0_g1_i1.p1  ORF type:complete len:188 (+),score=49.82 TRINITY_DN83503_c0_g1_i1:111-674(+)
MSMPGQEHRCILFLDIDGVMNSKRSRKLKFDAASGTMKLHDAPTEQALEQLRHIAHETCCEIVLSTTWRLVPEKLSQLDELLLKHDLKLLGSTPDLEMNGLGDRVDEILQWLKEEQASGREVDAWLSLDDLDLLAMNPRLCSENFVRVDDSVGLSRENAEEAVQKLLEQVSARKTTTVSALHRPEPL